MKEKNYPNIGILQKLLIVLFITYAGVAQETQCIPVKVTAVQLNIRSTPNISGNIVGRLSKDDMACAYTQEGNWIQIDKGWVSAKYLTRVHLNNSQQPASGNVSSTQTPVSDNNYRQDANASVVVKSNMDGEIAISVFVLMIAIYVVMLLFGMAGKVVIYYDEADLVISLLPWLTLFVTMVIAGIYQPTEQDMDLERMLQIQQVVWYVGVTLAVLLSLWAVWLSIKYNRSIPVGIAFGIFKLLSGLIGVLVLISQVFTMKDEKTKRKDFWFAILVFGAFWWLGKKLINGKKYIKTKDGIYNNELAGATIYFI